MRRSTVALLVAALAAGSLGAPAAAGKKKKGIATSGGFTVTLSNFP